MLTKSSLASRLSEPEMPAQQRAKMIQGAIYRTCGSHKGRMFSTGMVACDGYELRRLGRSAVMVASATATAKSSAVDGTSARRLFTRRAGCVGSMTVRGWPKMQRDRREGKVPGGSEPPSTPPLQRVHAALAAVAGVLFLFVVFLGVDDPRYGNWPYRALAVTVTAGLALVFGETALRFIRKPPR